MHDQVTMREAQRLHHLDEQSDAIGDRQSEPRRICVDRFAIDIFHDEIRAAIRQDAPIDQLDDVPVIERHQNPCLMRSVVTLIARRHHLDRRTLCEVAHPLGEKHLTAVAHP